MVANRKVTGKAMSMPAGIGTGLGISGSITLIGSAVIAWLISGEHLAESAIGYGAMVILLLSSAAGSWAAVLLIKHRRMLVCLISGASYFLLLLACTALFFGGQYQGIGMTALLILAGCGIVILLGLKGEKSGGAARHKRVSR